MFEKRVIPVLLINNKRLVKTVRFKNETYIGDPINAARIFSDKEVDELVICDKSASSNGVNFKMLEEIVYECFIPITYAGGVKDIQTMSKLYRMGIEKVCIDSHNYNDDYLLVQEAASRFGSSSVVSGVTIKKSFFGNYHLFNSSSQKIMKLDMSSHLLKLKKAGVGEIFINYADADGLMNGYDIEHIRSLTNEIDVPCVVCGGAGSIDHVRELLDIKGVTGAAAGSIFVYSSKTKGIMISYPETSIKSMLNI
ncbi:MAG: imidazole glycerol phosphate synthase subunit HisF [Rheinheimera sp.]|uniref:HisA/HisF-related TIM barrel protein n=1 Tax=Arsukibacterium sp. UBA3155 TaxID=1946058 RepID=UPI000C981D29|nr:HisA/HisF-related TIM barrel protein [Arsukibacterium sp. UBA3155]MAD74884.1 imidazole glycerol phosphate synthase subunit HisF [Rheinheimera sp.]